MHPRNIHAKTRPEAAIQAKLQDYLKVRDWLVKSTHGSAYQSGFPDLYCAHRKFGTRWIEVKNKTNYRFTDAQLEYFPLLDAKGVGIWILTDATSDEYAKLFKLPNWHLFLDVYK